MDNIPAFWAFKEAHIDVSDLQDRTFFYPGPYISFPKPSIPPHLTVAGLLSSDPIFGHKVFDCIA